MERAQWERVQSVFALAADLPAGEKRRVVKDHCQGDESLARSVLEMLEEDSRQQTLLDGDALCSLGKAAQASLESDHLRSLVQRQIGPYRLLRSLGEGGMGIVYLAERTDIGGLVAIKLLRDAWMSPMRRERFALEQQMLVKLNHPAIARLYDASTMEDGTPLFVMEYVNGRPLTEFLDTRGGGIREDLTLFQRVCEAVQYAHGHAIIHRDLKPSNILATDAGEVKLLDFGIAKQIQAGMPGSERTVAGLRLWSPGYAAPEQYAGGGVGVFTDVYSLGVMLYEILTGGLPESAEMRGERGVERPSTAVLRGGGSSRHKGLSWRDWSDLDLICMTALEVTPSRRYRSVDAMVRDVSAFLEGRVLEARPPSMMYTTRKFVERNRVVISGAMLGVLLLAIAGTVFTVRLAHARDVAAGEAARAQRIQQFMQEMLGDADVEAGPANDLKVVTLLDRAAKQADTLSGDPGTQIELYQTIGGMYDRLGRYEQSEGMLEKALALTRGDSKAGTGREMEIAILVQLATVRGDRGDVKQAKQNLEEATRLAEQGRATADSPAMIEARIAQGRLEVQSGEYQTAVTVLRPITQMQPSVGGVSAYELRDSVAALAVAEMGTQQYAQAELESRRAIELDRQLLGESHPQTAVDVMTLAAVKATLGQFAEAEQLYREGIATMKAWYGPEHPDVITASSILARVLLSERKDMEAEAMLTQVLQTQERIYGPAHERVAFTLDALGELARARGQTAEAEKDFQRAVKIDRSVLGENNARTAAELSNLGAVYLQEDKDVLAEATLRQAVRDLEALPPGSNYMGLTRARWGRALLALKRFPEAEQQLTSAGELLKGMDHPPTGEVENVRRDLATLYRYTH